MNGSEILGVFALLALFALSCYYICHIFYMMDEKSLDEILKNFKFCSWEMHRTKKGINFYGVDINQPGWEFRIELQLSNKLFYVKQYGPSFFGKSKDEQRTKERYIMLSDDMKVLRRIFNDEEMMSKSWNFKDTEELEAFLAVV